MGKIVEIPKVLYNQFGEPTAHINVCTKVIPDEKLPYAGNPWEDESLFEEWVLVVCRDALAEKVERELDGGDLVFCEGRLDKVQWLDGKKEFHKELGLHANTVELVAKQVFSVEKPKHGVKPNAKKLKKNR